MRYNVEILDGESWVLMAQFVEREPAMRIMHYYADRGLVSRVVDTLADSVF